MELQLVAERARDVNKLSRTLKRIIVHCSAEPHGRPTDAATIDRWHRARGWSGIGYHYVIKTDGTIEQGRALRSPGAHASGHNVDSIGICLVGGLDENMQPTEHLGDYNPSQVKSLVALVKALLSEVPGLSIHGHREFAAKACPCFDIKELKDLLQVALEEPVVMKPKASGDYGQGYERGHSDGFRAAVQALEDVVSDLKEDIRY